MSRFVLTAQLQLQAPNNVSQVVRQIQSQLNNVSVNVQVQGAQQAQRQLQQVTAQTQAATTAADRMGRAFAISIRRFAAFSIATRAVGLFTSTLSDAIKTAIDFEREMVRVSQVTGESLSQLKNFAKTVTNLSTSLGVASSDLLQAGQLLLQAGISAKDTEVALKTLARAALAPNFDSLSETTEGAIAILAQFGEGVGALEKQLGAINAVAGAFAVEAGDLIDVIRRAGGVFKSSGGDLNELIALFTSVRATTRESAESIGTGLRTIFTRIQRPKTIEFLKQFGVELVDLEGKFVGPYEAVRRLSGALSGLGEGDITFIRIAEELGGFRQIGKVLPLLQQFSTAQNALNVANKAGNSLTQDAATAQQALAIRILKVKEEFLALIRSMTETKTFQIMANTALSLASALIQIGEAIKPLLPLLAAVAAVNFTRGIAGFAGGMMRGMQSGRTYSTGGKVHHFARGGMVPGTGNRDTVPAMLQPGEFVIKKTSVNKLGASNLAAMNENKYAAGGIVQSGRNLYGSLGPAQLKSLAINRAGGPKAYRALSQTDKEKLKNDVAKDMAEKGRTKGEDPQSVISGARLATKYGVSFLEGALGANFGATINQVIKSGNATGVTALKQAIAKDGRRVLPGARIESPNASVAFLQPTAKEIFDNEIMGGLPKLFDEATSKFGAPLKPGKVGINELVSNSAVQAIKGYFFEGFARRVSQNLIADSAQDKTDPIFDFTGAGNVGDLKRMFGGKFTDPNEFKVAPTTDNIANAISKAISLRGTSGLQFFATGGSVGTDTVPALLTPGEFVVNRSSAQSIGYGNLNRMNKIGKYARGGVVQRFANGTSMSGVAPVTSGGSNVIGLNALSNQAQALANAQAQLTTSTQNTADSTDQTGRSMLDMAKNNRIFTASIIATVPAIIQGFLPALDEASSGMLKVTHYMLGLATTLTSVMFALEAFGVSLSAKSIMQLFGSGPGGLGSLMKNAFSGFKMGAAGIAGPQPLGGGIASRVGSMFGSAKGAVGNLRGALNNTLDPSLISPSFSLGRQGKSLTSMSGGRVPLSARLGNFAGRATQGMNLPNLGVGKALSGVSQRLSPYTSAIPTGFRAGFAGKNIVGGNMLSRSIGKASSGVGQFARGARVGFGQQNLSFGQILGSGRGVAAKAGGILGKVGGLATRAGGAALGGIGGGLGGAASAALSMAGPITAITGLVAIVNGAVGAFRDLDGQLQKSIQAGKIEEASKLAVAKAAADFPLIGNLISGWSSDFDNLLVSAGTIFGGPSLDSVKALAAAQAGAVKTQKELEKAQKAATNAMEDFENGSISASEALTRIRTATAEVAKQEKRASEFATANLENRASDGFTGRNIASLLTFGMVESSSARNQRLGQQSAEQINEAAKFEAQRFQMESGARAATIRSGFFSGRNPTDIKKEAMGDLQNRLSQQRMLGATLQGKGDEAGAKAAFQAAAQLEEQIKQVEREMVNLEKEVGIAKAKFEALNLGFRSVTASADAAAMRMTNAMNSFDLATVPGVSALNTLEASLTAAGQNISKVDFDSALGEVSGILKKFGADAKQITAFEDLTKGVATVQREFPNIFETLKQRIKSNEFRGMDAVSIGNEFKKIIGESLDKAGIGKAAKDRIIASMGDVQISPEDMAKIMAGDVDVLEKYVGDAAEEVGAKIKEFGDKWIAANQELIKATQERIEAERNLVAAQKEAVDLYMEGREIQAKYGGVAVTPAEKRAAILAKANAGASGAGIRQMRTGNVSELRARNAQIAGGFFRIESLRGTRNSEMGAQGTELQATQQNLEQAQKDQIQTIRDLIKLEEEELKIIQEKNKLEKDSMESLISGDIEKFFEQQAAVGAQAAIATGDLTLANQFGAKAIGDAFKDIQRQQEAGVQSLFGRQLSGPGGLTEATAGAALAARGIMDPRMAQTLAGTTPEVEDRKRRLQELGGVLGEAGAWQQATAEMKVQTAQMKVDFAQLNIDNLNNGGQGFAKGGVVYANRGMFVPRGTDTVPAMLTPGEFVVRREAVNRGNNLQLLEAINNNTSSQGFARGGKVGYYNNGGKVQYKAGGGILGNIAGAFGIDPQVVTNLGNVFNTFVSGFNDSIKNLQNTKLQVKLDSVNVNVNLNGTSMLTQISQETRNSIMAEVIQKIQNEYSVGGPGGKLIENRSNLGR